MATTLRIALAIGLAVLIFGVIVETKLQSVDKHGQPKQRREIVIEDSSTLQMMVIFHRHGDRTPVFYPERELEYVPWPETKGQLTSTGMWQLSEMGAALRERLSGGLIPESYRADIVRTRSTDYDRTLQSAFSFLSGLYPPGTGPTFPFENPPQNQTQSLPFAIQPIPIHTISRSSDYLLLTFELCHKYQKYIKDQVFKSAEVVELARSNADLLSLLSTTFNMEITLLNFNLAYDVLYCEHAHGYTNLRGIDDDTYNQVIALENYIFSQLEFGNNPQSYLIYGSLFYQLLDDMNAFINQSNTNTLIYHYSAHDITIGALLAGLRYKDFNEIPPYGANVVAELHLIKSTYYIRFLYNNNHLILEDCFDENVHNYCPLNQFKSTYGRVAMNIADTIDACFVDNSSPPPDPLPTDPGDVGEDDLSFWTWVILGVIGFMLLGVIGLVIVVVVVKKYQTFKSATETKVDEDVSYEMSDLPSTDDSFKDV